MITVHYNGDIVQHPDQKNIRAKIIQERDIKRACTFGVHEDLCKACESWKMQKPRVRLSLRCPLSEQYKDHKDKNGFNWRIYDCPRANQRYLNAIKPKSYTINWSTYRKMSSAAHYMIKEGEFKTVFITLTFGKFKKHEITERQANECFSKFAENVRKNYNIQHYIAVRERGAENNRIHYHCLFSMPFVSFTKLNRAWNSAIQEHCYYSECAFRTDKSYSAVIRNPARAIRYVCKYISKGINQKSSSRIVFISNGLLSQLYQKTKTNHLTGEVTTVIERVNTIKRTIEDRKYNIMDLLSGYKSIEITKYEHATTFKITERKEFNKFCHKFLYPVFECTMQFSQFYHIKSTEIDSI